MGTLLQDLRYGVRMLWKSPVVSAVAALSLGLGIAANTTMFALLDGFVLEPLPYEDQDGLVLIRELRRGDPIEDSPGVSVANYRDYVQAADGLEAAALYTLDPQNLTGVDVPEQLQVVLTTPALFDVLGVPPVLGRAFRPEEGAGTVGDVAVLEYDFWQTRFLGARDILGRTLTVDGVPVTVIGVMPEDFDMIPANVQMYRPTHFDDRAQDRVGRGYIALGRLAPGATLEQVQGQLSGVASTLARTYPEANRGWEVRAVGIRDFFPGRTDRMLISILTAVTLFGLLIACANVANLLLGRAEERQKEMAVRRAMGAGRRRVLAQLLTESVTLGLAAGAVGIALAIFLVRWLQSVMPAELPASLMPELDPGVLAATVAVSIGAGVVFGLAPALTATGGALRDALGDGARGGTAGRRRKRLRNAFVVGEFAVAVALLTGAAFLVQAFNSLSSGEQGFEGDGLLTFGISIPSDRYEDAEAVLLYQEELERTLAALPGVEGVAVMSSLPRGRGNPSAPYTVAGRTPPAETERPAALIQAVNPGYFATLGVELLAGRLPGPQDRADSPPIVVVNQAFVDREFPGEDPLGRTLIVQDEERTIVGVVEDILQLRISVAGRASPAMYVPLAQWTLRTPAFALRSAAADPATLAADVRRAVWGVDPDQPIARLRPYEDHLAESLAGPRAMSTFLSAMALLALGLAAMGIYGVMAHAVAQQTREIGIRVALGAAQGAVLAMVTRSGMALAGLGVVLGLPLTFVMRRWVMAALGVFETDIPFESAVFMTLGLLLVALVATYLPARKASTVAPVVALKE